MKFLGDVLQSIIAFFQAAKDSLSLEYLFYIFIGIELLTIFTFIFVINRVYEVKLMRAVDKLNAYLYNVQYIDDNNLIEFNNRMKKVPKILRYHWQQYMLYREKAPSHYMSVEHCVDRPIKASAFAANIKIIKYLGILYTILASIFVCGWTTGAAITPDYFLTIFTIPLVILFINYIFIIGLNAKRAINTRDLYQTFHIFNRFIDKAVTTMPEYVDFEVLFTKKEIKRGIPVLNEYIEKRQIQEQEEMRKAKENAVQHETFNFEKAEDKGELVLERAMKETEILINLKNRLNAEIDQIEKEIDSYKRNYDNTTKDYQKKLQASKENVERLREQQEATTNRIESNYIRKQQSDEIKKQHQIEKEQEDATLRFNQEINTLTVEINKRKAEIEEARKNVEAAMLSEYGTFANKIFEEIKADVNDRVKRERDTLIKNKKIIFKELEESLTRIDQLEKQNKMIITKAGERESFIRAEIGKENESLRRQIEELKKIISEKEQHIELISDEKNDVKKNQIAKTEFKNGKMKKTIIEGEFNFDEEKEDETLDSERFNVGFDGPVGNFDKEGNYRYPNGTYYDVNGYFHDENGNIFDPEGNLVNQKEIKLDKNFISIKNQDNENEENIEDLIDQEDDFDQFDVEDLEEENSDQSEIEKPQELEIESEPLIEETELKRKRGRPRKEVVVAEVVEPKRKRGRPRKEVVVAEVVEPKRKRGRPRKEVVVAEVKPKRKRGRPRKEVVVAEVVEPKRKRGRPRKEVVVAEVEPKRKRGRPRKEVVVADVEPKRKRGRPRKEVVVAEVEPKRQRGRPKKINIDDLKEIEKKLKKQNDILKEQQEDLNKVVKKVTKK